MNLLDTCPTTGIWYHLTASTISVMNEKDTMGKMVQDGTKFIMLWYEDMEGNDITAQVLTSKNLPDAMDEVIKLYIAKLPADHPDRPENQ